MENKKKILGFYILTDVRKKESDSVMGFFTRKAAEDFAIESGYKFAKILPIFDES